MTIFTLILLALFGSPVLVVLGLMILIGEALTIAVAILVVCTPAWWWVDDAMRAQRLERTLQ